MKLNLYAALAGCVITTSPLSQANAANGVPDAAVDVPGASGTASPDDGDTFKMFAADQESYDSNVYRIPSGASELTGLVGPSQSREDHINIASLEADGQWIFGRQTIILHLRADDNRFDQNTDLNNISGTARTQWNWQIGDKLSGQAGYDYNRSLAAFADTRYFALDLVESNQAFANARYQIGPRWAVYGTASEGHTSNSAAPERLNDFISKSGSVGIECATAVNNTVGWEYDRTIGSYPSDVFVDSALFNRNYIENAARFLATYSATEKTTLNVNAGYLKRDYPDAAYGAFSGDIWRVSLAWLTNAKLQFTFAGWHELQAYLDSQSNYFVSKGGSISPVWTVSEKLGLSGVISYANQNYIGSSLNVLTLGTRQDKVSSQQVSLNYTPRRAVILKLTYRYDQRKSNQDIFDFDDQLVSVSLKFTF